MSYMALDLCAALPSMAANLFPMRCQAGSAGNSVWIHRQVLGKGAFGTVYVAANKKTNQLCACKSIDKAKLVSEVTPLKYTFRQERWSADQRTMQAMTGQISRVWNSQ